MRQIRCRGRGRSGPTDRRVLEAFYMTAAFARSTKFRFAARTIGARAGMPWRTASEATGRLMKRKMVRFAGSYGPGLGTKYVLSAPRSWDTPNLHDRTYPPAPIVRIPGMAARAPGDALVAHLLQHAAFGTHALTDAGWMIAHWLDAEDPTKRRDLSAATGMPYERVRSTLSK